MASNCRIGFVKQLDNARKRLGYITSSCMLYVIDQKVSLLLCFALYALNMRVATHSWIVSSSNFQKLNLATPFEDEWTGTSLALSSTLLRKQLLR